MKPWSPSSNHNAPNVERGIRCALADGYGRDLYLGSSFRTAVAPVAFGFGSHASDDISDFFPIESPGGLFTSVAAASTTKRRHSSHLKRCSSSDDILDKSMKAGTPDAIDFAWIKHASGGSSHVTLKTYEQGREAFDGDAVHVIWLDEEPELAIYTESLLRTMTTKGIVYITFTFVKTTI